MRNYRLKPSARRLRRRWFIAFSTMIVMAFVALWFYPHPLKPFDFLIGFGIGGGLAGAVMALLSPSMMAKGENIDGYVAGYAAAVRRQDEEAQH